MEISSRNEFAAAPDEVIAMLTSQDYLERVARATDARSYEVTCSGMHTVTSRTFDTPSAAAKFAGPTLTIVEDVTWGEARPDGSRHGRLTLHAPGLPVKMEGTASVAPGGKGTVVDYAGNLAINIPFLGKKLEQQASPALTEALSAQQRVGDEWLAEH